jgi:hypothetical protein
MSEFNINEFNNRVKQVLLVAEKEFPAINARIGLNALGLIKNRIINEGKSASGSSFGKYSTNPLPAFYFAGKGLSGGADKAMESELKKQRKAGVKYPGVSYEKWRDINGLQTAHVDMKFSGDMWADMAVLETKNEGGNIITVVASKDSITKKSGKATIKTGQVAEYLAEQYGDFLEVSKEEEEALIEA